MEAAAAQTLVSVSTDHRQTVREACDAIRKALETSTRSKGMLQPHVYEHTLLYRIYVLLQRWKHLGRAR